MLTGFQDAFWTDLSRPPKVPKLTPTGRPKTTPNRPKIDVKKRSKFGSNFMRLGWFFLPYPAECAGLLGGLWGGLKTTLQVHNTACPLAGAQACWMTAIQLPNVPICQVGPGARIPPTLAGPHRTPPDFSPKSLPNRTKNRLKIGCRFGVVLGRSGVPFGLRFGPSWAPKSVQVRPKRPQDRPKTPQEGLKTGQDVHF